MFSKEQIEELSQFHSYFESAVVANYVRNIPSSSLAKIIDIWQKASGEVIREKMSCGVCQLNFFKKVGKHYFEDKKKMLDNETKKKTGGSTTRNTTSTRKSQSNTGNKRKSK